MIRLIARRVLLLIPTALVVSVAVFMLISLVPGDVAVELAGGQSATAERVEQVREQLGLDDPLVVQYLDWLGDVVTGDLGTSLRTGEPVLSGVWERFLLTFSLAMAALVVSLALAVPSGLVAGVQRGRLLDRLFLLVTSLGLAIPSFWLAMLLVSAFSVRAGWFPAIGLPRLRDDPTGWFRSAILPTIALSARLAATLARQLRASVVDLLDAPFVRTAWAKGAGPWRAVTRHVLRNASGPMLTVLALNFGAVVGGTVIIETIFAIPGLGPYFLQAVLQQDLPVVQGVVLLFVVLQLVIWLVTDVVAGGLNPRMREG